MWSTYQVSILKLLQFYLRGCQGLPLRWHHLSPRWTFIRDDTKGANAIPQCASIGQNDSVFRPTSSLKLQVFLAVRLHCGVDGEIMEGSIFSWHKGILKNLTSKFHRISERAWSLWNQGQNLLDGPFRRHQAGTKTENFKFPALQYVKLQAEVVPPPKSPPPASESQTQPQTKGGPPPTGPEPSAARSTVQSCLLRAVSGRSTFTAWIINGVILAKFAW